MKVYTRTGDGGLTGLRNGARVSKSSERVAAYGDVDELNCVLGQLRAEALPADLDEPLERTQSLLFDVGGFLADPTGRAELPEGVLAVDWLEQWIDAMDAELPRLRNFILPAGARPAALAHVVRSVCRRAERRVVALRDADQAAVAPVLVFLNRLSDALFVLARVCNHRAGITDVLWRAR